MGCATSSVSWSSNVDGLTNLGLEKEVMPDPATHNVCPPSHDISTDMSLVDEHAIAIVGIGCRTPGADNIREYWRLLVNGECHVTDVPASRWNASAYYDEDRTAPGKAYVQRGGFVSDQEGFDNGLFGINDFEASQMDPQQRFLLECTKMAMEDAGFTRAQLSGSNTGVYIGAMNCDYRCVFSAYSAKVGNYTATGISNSFLAGRISYVYNLLGPSMVIDTACSASLVSVHLACQAILTGDCDMAICGGVNNLLLPDVFVHLSKANMISPTGLCHTFSDKADGYTRSEGCGVVILKRLKEALRDGDKIWATVCTGSNQDGHTVTPMTAPSGDQQKKLLHKVYGKFGINIDNLDYIEAHGTGTVAGDPVEVNALGSFFKEYGKPHCRYIGSVKTNIGHTESASGILSLIKLCLMMKNKLIVPSLHCDTVHPKIKLSDLGLIIPKECIPWTNPDKLTCCNSFGFGGTNCHAILKSYRRPGAPEAENERQHIRDYCIVCFSANTAKSLKGTLEDLSSDEFVQKNDIHDLSYTSTVRRDHFQYRLAFIVEDIHELLALVGERLMTEELSPALTSTLDVVFVFCGMGTAWKGMCSELMTANNVFRDTMMSVEKYLSHYVSWSLTERMMEEDSSKDPLLSPIAIFACQVALAAVWKSMGIEPRCVVGQSIGEVAAAYAAGCLNLADAIKIVYHRSNLLAQISGGRMLVVQNVNVEKVRERLKSMGDKATISLEYSPTSCSVSADADSIATVRQHLFSGLKAEHRGMQLMDLDVSVAYHSHHVDACLDKLATAIKGITASNPKVPFISTVSGSLLKQPPDARYWVSNLRQPVLFGPAIINAFNTDGISKTVFLEIGPKPVLKAHLKALFPNEKVTAIVSMSKQPELKVFLQAIAEMYELGADINWKNLSQPCHTITEVPRYVFDKKYLMEKSETEQMLFSGFDFLRKQHLYTYPIRGSVTSYRLMISPLCTPSIYDHVISGRIIIPGAFYAEAGFAVAQSSSLKYPVSLSIEFVHVFATERDAVVDFEVEFEPQVKTEMTIMIQKNGRKLATIQVHERESNDLEDVNMDFIICKCRRQVSKGEIYSKLRKFGFEYGEAFSLLEHAYKGPAECLALLKVNKTVENELPGTILHPCILDCMLQTSVLAMIDNGGDGQEDLLPKSIGKLAVTGKIEMNMFVHTRLKEKTNKSYIFDQRLLSPSGHVIAYLDDLVVQVLSPVINTSLPPLLKMEWRKRMSSPKLKQIKESKQLAKADIVFLSNRDIFDGPKGCVVISYDDKTHNPKLKEQMQNILSNGDSLSSVVVVYSKDVAADEDGEAIHSQVLNMCCLLQAVLTTISDLSLTVPFYLCTFNAWPSLPDDDGVRFVNPVSTALWGLIRTAVQERVYPSVTAIELQQQPENGIGSALLTFFHFIITEKELRDYPEILVSEKGIFVNQIAEMDPNMTIPSNRSHVFCQESNANASTLILSESCKKISKPIVTYCKSNELSRSTHVKRIKVKTCVYPCESLLKLKMESKHLLPERKSTASSFVITAMETIGCLEDPGIDVASCCPTVVGTDVFLPEETFLPINAIADYQPGDLSKLIFLWTIICSIHASPITILASKATIHFVQLIQSLHGIQDSTTNNSSDVIMLENIEVVEVIRGTLVSLVFVDSALMHALVQRWENANQFISCSSLVSSEALTLLTCRNTDTNVSFISAELVYSVENLKKSVPHLKAWLEKHKLKLDSILPQSLHCESMTSSNSKNDLAHLLKFKSQNLNSLTLTVEDHRLFRKDCSYIVIGGLSGLGWICVNFLAENEAGYIAIFNRRVPAQEQVKNMAQISYKYNCQVKYFQSDITSMDSLNTAFQKMLADSSAFQLKGVFTGAVVVEDGFFQSLTRSSFDKVLSPKVKGSWNLHQLTKNIPLDYFVLHSSVAAILGNAGQSNYSAGNAFMDGLAHYRCSHGQAAQTINWGVLDTGLLDQQDDIKQKLESMGYIPATTQEIKNSLSAVLKLNWPQTLPIKINKDVYAKKMYNTAIKPFIMRMKNFIPQPSAEGAATNVELIQNVRQIKMVDPAKRVQAYQAYIRTLTSRVLGVDISRVTLTSGLVQLGMDSLSATMMMNQIHRDTSLKLAMVEFLAGEATVTSLAKSLDNITGLQA